jgi:hypothetical protein
MNLVISQRTGERTCEGLFCCFCSYDEFCLGCFIHSSRSGCEVMLHDHILFLCFGCLLALSHFISFVYNIYIILNFFHFIFHFRLNLCLSGHTLKLCSIGLPSHHDRQLHSTNKHEYALGKRKGSTLGERPLPFWPFDDSNVLPYITLRLQTYQVSSFAQLACRTCTVVGFIARFCSLGNERDSFWESVPSPILSNYSRLRLRPRKTTSTGESFAQLACRVYIIVGFIARFFVV